jgi:hypothetical protein
MLRVLWSEDMVDVQTAHIGSPQELRLDQFGDACECCSQGCSVL